MSDSREAIKRYVVRPNDDPGHPSLYAYSHFVWDSEEKRDIAYTSSRELAEGYAIQMNEKGFIGRGREGDENMTLEEMARWKARISPHYQFLSSPSSALMLLHVLDFQGDEIGQQIWGRGSIRRPTRCCICQSSLLHKAMAYRPVTHQRNRSDRMCEACAQELRGAAKEETNGKRKDKISSRGAAPGFAWVVGSRR